MKMKNLAAKGWGTRKTRLASLALVPTLAFATGGAAWAAQAHKTVTINVDGQVQTVTTWSGDVSGALDSADITVSKHDDVSPAVDSTINDGAAITVDTARKVAVTVAGKPSNTWTTAGTTAEVIDEVSTQHETNKVSVPLARTAGVTSDATDAPLTSSGTVTVIADGKSTDVNVDALMYTDDILKAAKVQASPIDQVSASTDKTGQLQLTVTRVERGTETKTEAIDYDTQTVEDNTLAKGTTQVVQAGSKGERTIVSYVETVNGKNVVSQKLSDQVTTKPVNEIVHVGTYEAPAATETTTPTASTSSSTATSSSTDTTTSSTSSSAASSSSSATASGDDAAIWASIAQCESGGNPTTNTGNGYYGLYQFSLQTWQSYGGTGLPSEASAAEQLRIAKLVQQSQGWGAWPSCAAAAGAY